MVACTPQPDVIEPNYFPTEVNGEGVVRGGMGSLTAAELEVMQGLAWPQTYADMKGTFGVANRSTETVDIYFVESTSYEVWVFYEGDQATGYELR
ncbi:MAG: hypothetical protein AAGE59_35210 [Cyanobacteria bacterium P01_F01_bin.86]